MFGGDDVGGLVLNIGPETVPVSASYETENMISSFCLWSLRNLSGNSSASSPTSSWSLRDFLRLLLKYFLKGLRILRTT